MTSRVLGVVLAALAVVLLLLGVGGALLDGSPGERPSAPAPTARPTGDEAETVEEQIQRIATTVADIRGLDFAERPVPTYLTQEELQARVEEDLQTYTDEDADLDRRILEALGAVDPGTDLRELLIGGLAEQVGGFYDPETGELVVGRSTDGERLSRLEELTLAHELQHALADQALGLPEYDEVDEGQEDVLIARQSLVEGDATVTMSEYAAVGFSAIDRMLLPGELAELADQLAGVTQLPHVVQRSFTFPYEEGAGFVSFLIQSHGWEAVDAAYADPPTTSLEILFPDRYPRTPPDPVEPPQEPGQPWTLARRAAFGAADLMFLFEAPGDDPTQALERIRETVSTWRDGTLRLFTDGDRSAVAVAIATDDLDRMCRAVAIWYERAHGTAPSGPPSEREFSGPDQAAALRCADGQVRLGIAPDPETAAALSARP